MGSPSAPPRRPRNTEADELRALSVVLGAERDKALFPKPSNRAEASIIKALETSDGPLKPVEIARHGQLSFLTLSKGLLALRRRGIITLNGPPGDEMVSLRSDLSELSRAAQITS